MQINQDQLIEEDIPNEKTIEAIEETRAEHFAGALDMSSLENFMKSLEGID